MSIENERLRLPVAAVAKLDLLQEPIEELTEQVAAHSTQLTRERCYK